MENGFGYYVDHNADQNKADALKKKESSHRDRGAELNDQMKSTGNEANDVRKQRTNKNQDFLHNYPSL